MSLQFSRAFFQGPTFSLLYPTHAAPSRSRVPCPRAGAIPCCPLRRASVAESVPRLPSRCSFSPPSRSLFRVWEFAGGAWRQVAAMPPAMSHAFRGAKADVNCVGHGGRVMVCVSSSSAGGCFMCDVRTNRWEELPRRAGVDVGDAATGFVAALSFEPRMEAAV